MRKVIYRMKFKLLETGRLDVDRREKIDSIFLNIKDIETFDKIDPPPIGSIIQFSDEDFEVLSIKYNFSQDEDFNGFINYNMIVEIIKAKTKLEIEQENKKKETDLIYQKIKDMIFSDRTNWGKNFKGGYYID